MPLVPPTLDDIGFNQLVRMAVDRVKQECPEWNDLSPGMTCLPGIRAWCCWSCSRTLPK
jgi:hypothetical protein